MNRSFGMTLWGGREWWLFIPNPSKR